MLPSLAHLRVDARSPSREAGGWHDACNVAMKRARDDQQSDWFIAAHDGNVARLEELLAVEGVDVDMKDHMGRTALSTAARHAHVDIVRLLVRKGADVNLADNNGDTPLWFAAFSNVFTVPAISELLKARNINVNAVNYNGNTALKRAARWGQVESVRALLNVRGIDVGIVDRYGGTALDIAVYNNHAEIANALRDKMRMVARVRRWWGLARVAAHLYIMHRRSELRVFLPDGDAVGEAAGRFYGEPYGIA